MTDNNNALPELTEEQKELMKDAQLMELAVAVSKITQGINALADVVLRIEKEVFGDLTPAEQVKEIQNGR